MWIPGASTRTDWRRHGHQLSVRRVVSTWSDESWSRRRNWPKRKRARSERSWSTLPRHSLAPLVVPQHPGLWSYHRLIFPNSEASVQYWHQSRPSVGQVQSLLLPQWVTQLPSSDHIRRRPHSGWKRQPLVWTRMLSQQQALHVCYFFLVVSLQKKASSNWDVSQTLLLKSLK